MQDLFLSFDSSSQFVFSFNWVSVLAPLWVSSKYWVQLSQFQKLFKMMDLALVKEMKVVFGAESGVYLCFVALFQTIMICNVSGLLPYVFTPTSHLVLTLAFSIPLWLGVQMFGWAFSFNKMACHLVPMSTPMGLVPFLVLVESLSNLIRPFTLAIRLAANMTAGHLLMCLLGSSTSVMASLGSQVVVMAVMVLLLVLEIAVAFIQSYVFMLLSSLYTSEAMLEGSV